MFKNIYNYNYHNKQMLFLYQKVFLNSKNSINNFMRTKAINKYLLYVLLKMQNDYVCYH